MTNQLLTVGDVITVGVFLVTLGGVVYKTSSNFATLNEQIKTLFKRADDKDVKDREQDEDIKEVRHLTNATDKKVAVIDERTKNMDAKLDQLLSRD